MKEKRKLKRILYQHSYKCRLPSSILTKHHYDLRIGEFTLLDLKLEISLSFTHGWILVSSICLNFFGTFLWSLGDLSMKKIGTSIIIPVRIQLSVIAKENLTLKVRDSSRNLRFSVGTNPARNILIPSLTENGRVTTPYTPGFP